MNSDHLEGQPSKSPNLPSIETAMRFHNEGRLSEAESIYRQILKAEPDQPQALHLLGLIAHQMGRSDIAVDLIGRSITIDPKYTEAYGNLGLVTMALGNLDEAVLIFQKALALDPDYAEANANLGLVLQNSGKLDEAIESYQKALEIRPDFVEALINLGNVYKEQNELNDAVDSYNKALAVNPDFAGAYCNLGMALKALGQIEKARASFDKAITLEPDLAEAHHGLGLVYQIMENSDRAIASIQRAISLKPDFADAYNDLGLAFKSQGKIDEAAEQIDLALSFEPNRAGWLVTRKLMLPIIPSSQEQIQESRDLFSEGVKSIIDAGLTVKDPLAEIDSSTFYLGYHNLDNRTINESVAKMHIALCPKLTYEAEHCRADQVEKKDTLRIGFLSSFLKDHTIGKLNRGFIQHFSRDIFEVIVLHPPGTRDHMSDIIDSQADKVVSLSGDIEKDHSLVENEELDILFYLDIGMDPYSYFLSLARLAPVQAVTWGHPDMTGVPNVDYFISSELIEDPDSSDQYSEQLVQLKNINTYFFRPELPDTEFTRDDFGLPQDVRLYICPQSLFKFHPQFDDILGEILRQDTKGRLILIGDNKSGHWQNLLVDRFKKAFPDFVDHVIFVPPMPTEKFFGLVNLADALLDIPTFSGGNTTLEAFAMNKPIVTWPQSFLRGRLTAGFYKQLGVNELIADDEDSYVKLALRLAQDPEFSQRLAEDIQANAHKIFEREAVVREMESFFVDAYEAWRTGGTVTETSRSG